VDELLCDIELGLNEEALQERSGEGLVAYQDVRVWGRSNHLAVRRGKVSRSLIDYGRRAVLDVPIQCLAQGHPSCRLRYVRLFIDFRRAQDGTAQQGVQVEDLSPRLVEGPEPVKIVTKRAGELKFEVETVNLGASVSAEESREAMVYFPVVRGAGVGFGFAMWDFEPLPGVPLQVDRQLRMLVSCPLLPDVLSSEFRVEARVEADGLRGLVPLIGSRRAILTAAQQLD
jgi:hypothetical protein